MTPKTTDDMLAAFAAEENAAAARTAERHRIGLSLAQARLTAIEPATRLTLATIIRQLIPYVAVRARQEALGDVATLLEDGARPEGE